MSTPPDESRTNPGRTDGPAVVVAPPGAEWARLIGPGPGADIGTGPGTSTSTSTSAGVSAAARALRRELGLPETGRVIMSGHQAGFWHAGILAKLLALAHAGAALGAATAWVVVDQDVNDFARVTFPVGRGAALRRGVWTITPPTPPWAEAAALQVATGSLPAFEPAPLPAEALGASSELLASVRAGLTRMRAALQAHRDAPSAAMQLARAALDLARPFMPADATPTLIPARALGGTGAMAGALARFAADPLGAAGAYNAAVARTRDAGVAPLRTHPRVELPVWDVGERPGDARIAEAVPVPVPRRRVYLGEALPSPSRLAPRALLLTALLRAGGAMLAAAGAEGGEANGAGACDLFIHGTGGAGLDGRGGYDAVTDAWTHAWLGATPARAVTVTATLRLPLLDRPPLPEAAIRRAVWGAHHAAHSPEMLGEAGAQAQKRTLAAMIARTRDRAERARLFARLHALLDEVRGRAGPRLAELAREAAAIRRRARDEALAADRTWPFPLHDDAALAALSAALARAVR